MADKCGWNISFPGRSRRWARRKRPPWIKSQMLQFRLLSLLLFCQISECRPSDLYAEMFWFFFHWRQVLSAAQEQIITLWNMTSRCRGNALPPRHLRPPPPIWIVKRSATLRQYTLWLSILGKCSCWCCCFVVWHSLASQPAGQRSVWGG